MSTFGIVYLAICYVAFGWCIAVAVPVFSSRAISWEDIGPPGAWPALALLAAVFWPIVVIWPVIRGGWLGSAAVIRGFIALWRGLRAARPVRIRVPRATARRRGAQ